MNFDKIILPLLLFIVFSFLLIKKYGIKFIIQLRELYHLRKDGKNISGIVVDFRIDTDQEGVKSYIEIFQFQVDERTITITSKFPNKDKPIIGNEVSIIYDPKNPSLAITNIDSAYFKVILGIVIIFLVLSLLGVLTFTLINQ